MKTPALIILLTTLFTAGCSTADFNRLMSGIETGSPDSRQVAEALREALAVGVNNGADMASRTDGFFLNPEIRIELPPDARAVEQALRQLGLGSQADQALLTINRAAERAAAEARPIFAQAVRQLTFQDALRILHGESDAATQYLRRATEAELTDLFQPKIREALDRTGATRHYGDLARAFNAIPFTGASIEPDLDRYVTRQAMDGLFTLIAEEEQTIRANPAARATELLRRVFAEQDARPRTSN